MQTRTIAARGPDEHPGTILRPSAAPADDDGDAALAAQAVHDRDAFALLYDRHVDMIYRYCHRRLGERDAAEDATSAVFIKVLTRIATYRAGSGGFRAWLFTIAHNVVTDVYRDRARKPCVPFTESHDRFDPGHDPELAAIAAEEADRLRALLVHLTPDQRDVIELRLAGLSGPEIAAVLGRSRGSINLAQHRAMKRLQQLFAASGDQR